MVECGGLENRYGCKPIGGSNPPLSASTFKFHQGTSQATMPFLNGPIAIENPIFLAPMSGVTDLPFHRMVKSFGADLTLLFSRKTVSI